MISAAKQNNLIEKMDKLDLHETDLVEKFIIGSGKGGQKLHKTASTVYLKHLPSGLEIKCQDSRSREDNRYFARERLCEKLQELIGDEKTPKQQKTAKIKHQKKRRSRRALQKLTADADSENIL